MPEQLHSYFFMKTSLILFLIALTLRLGVVFFWQFDGLYGQDAYAYLRQAVAIAQTLPHGQPPPTDFFWPNGFPLLIAFWMLFVGQTAWAGQLAALLCGAALAPLSFLLSCELFSENNSMIIRSHYTGLLAGFIVAVAGQPILSSVVIMADMPALFWATLAAWLVIRAVNLGNSGELRGTQGNSKEVFSPAPLLPRSPALLFFAAGVALALAIISRWLYVLIVPALGFYIFFNFWSAKLALPNSKASFALQFKNFEWSPLLAVCSGALILAPQLWLSLNKPEGLAHSWLLGWSPAHFFQREFENIDGHFLYQLPNFIFYAQPAGHPAYIFPLLGVAALWAIWRLGQTRQWGALILLLGWVAPVYLFLAGIPYQNFRFGLTLYPPLVILTGYGLSDFLSGGEREQGSRGEGERRRIFSPAPLLPCPSALFKLIIVLSLLGMLAWAYPMLDNFLTVQNQSKIIAAQVEQTLPKEATLITFGLTLTLQHYTQLNTLEFFYLDAASLQTLAESPGPLYLLLDVGSIETQWRGKTPQINYQWLKKNTTLTPVGDFSPYTLFKVTK
ncbi:MAG: phospholipid carrier-dependent glycosyltransferase [Anaerolineales bacterium]|nr:phospholipid carrier-dependent glycosyltransferase [Anaerolineales bacterium]